MKKAASDSTSPQSRKKPSPRTAPAAASKPPARKPTRAARSKPGTTPPEPVAVSAPGAAASDPTPLLTVVAARVDIGFGNHLFLRGTGPGLSWDTGVPMTNVGSDLWSIDLLGARGPIFCKFLINDEKWSAGPDYVIEPGAQLEVTPLF